MKPIDQVLKDLNLLGAALGDAGTWITWMSILCAAFGLPLDDEQLQIFMQVAGGRPPPTKRVRELWVTAGRRSGKSRVAAAIAVYMALFQKYKLAKGERGLILILSMTQDQAKTVFNYIMGFLTASDILAKEVASFTTSEIRLKNGITIAIHTSSFRSVRGPTLCCCILDEVAFFHSDTSANPDVEIYTAILPSLLTTRGLLVGISSAYKRQGLLYSKHKDFYGVDDANTLVIKGTTQDFNLTVDDSAIAAMRAADPSAAASEWDSIWRDDLGGFLDDKVIDAAVNTSRPLELPPQPNRTYRAFCDASGGAASGDEYALCICSRVDGRYVVDLIRAKQGPFNPRTVTEDFAALCKQYRVSTITGDNYAKEWVQSAWRDCGITYNRCEQTASELFGEAEALFNRGLVELPDEPITIKQLRQLERRPGNTGRDMIGHPRGLRDDRINAVCGALVLADTKRILFGPGPESDWVSGPSDREQSEAARKKAQSDSNARWQIGRMMRANGFW